MGELFGRLAPHTTHFAVGIMVSAAFVFPLLFFVSAPYGRHYRPGWGPSLGARLSWVLMELPSLATFCALWWVHPQRTEPVVMALGFAYLIHYVQRVFGYSLLQRGGKPNALLTVAMAVVFNLANASGNAVSLTARPVDAAFVVGLSVMAVGFAINLQSDFILRRLRAPGESGYKIPYGGLYRWVSCPNYLGELMEWAGFALAAQTLPALAFLLFTFANLGPRAASHHTWYRGHFSDYPPERKALVPFVW